MVPDVDWRSEVIVDRGKLGEEAGKCPKAVTPKKALTHMHVPNL